MSLEPDPIPLDVKVVLFGDRLLYYLLVALDPERREHFKVLADFDDDVDRSPESEALHARLIASIVKRTDLKPVDRGGVALADRARRAPGRRRGQADAADRSDPTIVLAEADYWAGQAKRATMTREDIAACARAAGPPRLPDAGSSAGGHPPRRRADRYQRPQRRPGQWSRAALELGGFRFGRPTRITARVRPGSGSVVDIEREVELGGPLHSKGVMILCGFLAGRYALDVPMSLCRQPGVRAVLRRRRRRQRVVGRALCAAVGAGRAAAAPVLAVTGSVNQHGEVQAIGGVNEKIEGFFDICDARGLTEHAGRADPAGQRAAPDAAPGRGGGLRRREVRDLSGRHDRRRASRS